MKYAVFWATLAMVPLLAWSLSLKRSWIRWAFFGMVAGLYFLEPTSINFWSREFYRGTSRGMEVTLIHLLALAVVGAMAVRGKWEKFLPEGGIRIFLLYFLLCLPGLRNADGPLYAWFEIWKMMMLFLFWHAVYGYLSATRDIGTVVKALALFVILNAWAVVRQHYGGIHMAKGIFPHRNGMAMAMNLLGPLFMAGYLQLGLKDRLGRWCFVAFAGAALSSMWSYSRGAIAMVPVGYGVAAFGSFLNKRWTPEHLLPRVLPLVLAGLLGLVQIWPHLVERYTNPVNYASKQTRIELAYCAWEMMKEHPLAGVGINNWSLNLQPEHPYQDRASDRMGRVLTNSGVVETVYLLVGAECGIPALLAMLLWFAWHGVACLRMAWRLKGSPWHFVPAGLLGGFCAVYLQSTLEWVLRQRTVMFLLVFCFALVAHMRREWLLPELARRRTVPPPEPVPEVTP